MTFADDLRARAAAGPISLHDFMAAANAHYYATRDPLGAAGDFTTAPEVSQMFGELVGVWLADLWLRAGRPAANYVELGPGRGTLATDARRAMRKLGFDPSIHLVETSPALRAKQAELVSDATWYGTGDHIPTDAPLLIVANEFFDALPIHQFVKTGAQWRERAVEHDGEALRWTVMDAPAPADLPDVPEGTLVERGEAAAEIAADLGGLLARVGGAALVIDYGYVEPATGDTLQAMRDHAFVDPLAAPGEADLTAHVDFAALAGSARKAGLAVHGPVAQGTWLRAMGIGLRTARLSSASPARADEFAAARDRLISPDQMGALFKVVAFTAPGWPVPAGFAP